MEDRVPNQNVMLSTALKYEKTTYIEVLPMRVVISKKIKSPITNPSPAK